MKSDNINITEDKSPYSYLLIDSDFKIVRFNDYAYESIISFLKIKMHIGMSVMDIIQDEFKEISREIFDDAFRGNFIRREFKLVSPLDNKDYYYEYIYNPVFDKDNIVNYISISAVNVTHTKRLSIDLEESEKRYKGIVNLQESLLIRVGVKSEIIFVNDAYCRKFGKTVDELLGNTFIPLVHQDDLNFTLNEMKKLYEPPFRVSLEQRAYTVDGWRWLHWEYVAIKNENDEVAEIQGVGRDITELKESISSLSETNELLNTILSSSPLGIVVVDLGGKVKFWSNGAESMFQWNSTDVIGKYNPVIRKDDIAEYNKNCIKLFEGVSLHENNLERLRKDGTVILTDEYNTPLKNSNGDITAGLLIYQDVTEKVKVEFDNLKLSSVFNSSNAAIAILNDRFEVESINKRYSQITGFVLKDVRGKNLRDISPPQLTEEEYGNIVAALVEGEEWKSQMINVTKSGNPYWESIVISPVSNLKGVIGNYLLIKEDISENKKAVQELFNSRLRLGTILNSISNIVLYEFGGKEPFISSNVQKILGYSAESILGKSNFVESIIVQEDISYYLSEFNKWNIGNSREVFKISFRCRTADDKIIWVENIMSKVDESDYTYYCGVLQDITDFKNKEEIIAWNETLLRIMTDSTRYAYYVENNNTDSVLYVNEKFCSLWNIHEYYEKMIEGQIKSSEVLRLCSANVINPESFLKSAARYSNPENQITFEDEVNFVNGRTIRRFSSLLLDKDDAYLGRFFLYEDITEKKFYEKIQGSKTDYNVVIEQAIDGTLLFDLRGAIKGANVLACKLLGYPKHELIKINFLDLLDKSEPDYIDPKFIDALDGKTILAKRKLIKADGSFLFAEIHSKMLPNRLIQSVIWEIDKQNFERSNAEYTNLVNPYVNLLVKLKVFKHGESSLTCLNRISLFMKNYNFIPDFGDVSIKTDKEILNRFISLVNEFEHSVYPQLEYILSILKELKTDFPKSDMHEDIANSVAELEVYSKKLNTGLKNLKKFIKNRDTTFKLNDLVDTILGSIVKVKSKMKIINTSFDENFTSDLESILHVLIKSYSDSNPELRITYKDFSPNPDIVFNRGELVDLLKIFFDNSIESYSNSEDPNSLNRIDITANQENNQLFVEIIDYGMGVPDNIRTSILQKGISTKGKNRGFGLSYANTVLQKYGGKFHLDSEFKQGAKFKIILNTL